ncbi:hypothetical protein K1T71_013085 [Dendrolimus kikuchii]|uniref:Uncharacterized protein n=1 Tax=Dendrolimus kikuchii TaxID=765133 RepID=A0ACC1CJ21_9NEOP|nr:hypothetical protein K1T71_013085 [Dendrolimus kikuchii]
MNNRAPFRLILTHLTCFFHIHNSCNARSSVIKKLVVGGPNQRNWRGILIALLVIVAVLALIVTSVVLLTPPDEGPRVKGRRLRIQDLLTDELKPIRWNGTWISGSHKRELFNLALCCLPSTVLSHRENIQCNVPSRPLHVATFLFQIHCVYEIGCVVVC